MATHVNSTVVRAFEILKVIGGKEKRWNAREVSEALGLNLATVHRFVITLERLGALTRDPNGYLHPGILLADICSDIVYDDLLANIITPHMPNIVEIANETVHAGVLNAGNVRYIAKFESQRSLKISTYIGKLLPAYCTAMGRLLLSGLSVSDLDRYLATTKLERLTPQTITDGKALTDAIRKASRDGFAIDDQETEDGLLCIAVPIVNRNRQICAAISVSGPASRMQPAALGPILAALQDEVKKIEERLDPQISPAEQGE